ncbi:hypothetical protein MASR2M79_11320 [Aminivibrio sp.]
MTGAKRSPERKSAVSRAGHPSKARSRARRAAFQRRESATAIPSFREKGRPYREKLSMTDSMSGASPQTVTALHPGKGLSPARERKPSPADQKKSSRARVSVESRRSPAARERAAPGSFEPKSATTPSGNC